MITIAEVSSSGSMVAAGKETTAIASAFDNDDKDDDDNDPTKVGNGMGTSPEAEADFADDIGDRKVEDKLATGEKLLENELFALEGLFSKSVGSDPSGILILPLVLL